jgi:uncharacterized protein YceK
VRLYIYIQAVFLGILLAGIIVVFSGCSSVITPTVDPMQAWADAHAHEVCVLSTAYVDGAYVNRGVLVPIEVWVTYPNTVRTMPISYCNPAE